DPYSSLNPKMRVGEAIVEVMKVHKLHGSRKERIIKAKELLVKVGLEADHFYRYPFEFSGGQRQRVSIARALAVEPQLIICDESVSALDVSVQSMVLNLLNDLKEQLDLTYLFISHDLSVIRYMSDEIIVLQNGKIVERGNAKQVYENPVATYTKELIDAIPTKKLASYTHKN
ncbi:MAG: ATP-binding cassette domain-containing protein, partial [Cyclobacteriaceae bacterium]